MGRTIMVSVDPSGNAVHWLSRSKNNSKRAIPACGAGLDVVERTKRVNKLAAAPACPRCHLKLQLAITASEEVGDLFDGSE